MRSIRGKFLQLNLISILLCVLLIGGFGLWSISSLQADSSQEILGLTCRVEGQSLDDTLNSIKASVDLFCQIADSLLPSLDSLGDQDFVDGFYAELEQDMGQITLVTRGVCAYYFRTAPELTQKSEGFFYGKRPGSELIEKEPLTDLSVYDPSDTEHVGWYYQPQAAGKAIWMEPYYNQNLGVYMISYVVPLYRDGVFWGIAGMDVDFDIVIERVRSIHPYESGYAFLCSDGGLIYYHPSLEIGTSLIDCAEELSPLPDAFSRETASETHPCFHYHYGGIGKTLSFYRLVNGMELLLTAENREIKAPLVTLFKMMTAVAVVMCTAVVLIIIPISNRITRPLEKLTQAARKIAIGNLDVDLPAPGADEVGILARAFAVTVSNLKQYIANMYDMAYTDPLTHIKNKTAYDRAVLALQGDMDRGRAEYALAMFDINDLKLINDRCGHDRGDEYIVGCCRLICSVFKHSPIFRIGGDEFIAVLTGDSLAARDELFAELEQGIEESRLSDKPWQRYSIAKGAAVCMPEDKSPEDVFVRADRAMYADKRRMKGE